MTKKQLEKQRKEFDEFVANVEKMGGRFLTEDELRLKINGGGDAGGDGDDDGAQEENESTPTEAGGTDGGASDPAAETAGESQAGNENEDSSGKSEAAAEEDDDKSFWDSVCEAVGGVVDTVAGAVSDAAHAVGEFIEDVIDFFTGGSEDDEKEEEDSGNGTETGAANSTDGDTETENSKSSDTAQNKLASDSEGGKTESKYGEDVAEVENKGKVDIYINGTRVIDTARNISDLMGAVPKDKDILDSENAAEIVNKLAEVGVSYDKGDLSLIAYAGMSFPKEENAYNTFSNSTPSLFSTPFFNVENVTLSVNIKL